MILTETVVRYVFSAAASAFVLPLAEAIGWGPTMTIASVICVSLPSSERCYAQIRCQLTSLQWLALIALLAVIKWGHIWRQKTNLKQGINNPDDERSPPDQTDPTPEACDVEQAPGLPYPKEEEDEAREAREPVSDMSPRGRQGEMPPVRVVLSRTISLSQASAHGG